MMMMKKIITIKTMKRRRKPNIMMRNKETKKMHINSMKNNYMNNKYINKRKLMLTKM